MKKMILDDYEKEIVESVENNEWESTDNLKSFEKDLIASINYTHTKHKTIKVNLDEKDYYAIKEKSAEFGIPYQSLISAILHNFASGQIKLKFE